MGHGFKRVVAVVKFLVEQVLPFRGHSDIFGQPDIRNFMGVLEVIIKFDPFLKVHTEK